MNRVILLTILWLLPIAPFAKAEPLPDVDSKKVDSKKAETPDPKSPPPEEKGINRTEEVQGEKHEVEGEVSTRQEFIYPSNYGTAGIFRIRSAESLPDGTLTFGVGGEFYSVANPFGVGNANTIAESLFIGYSPTDRLTLALMRRNSSTTFGEPQQLISSLGDINFTGQYAFPVSKTVTIAPIFNFLVASNFNNLAHARCHLHCALLFRQARSTTTNDRGRRRDVKAKESPRSEKPGRSGSLHQAVPRHWDKSTFFRLRARKAPEWASE